MRWWHGRGALALLATMACARAEAPASGSRGAMTRALALTADAAVPSGDAGSAATTDADTPEVASCCVTSDTPGCAEPQVAECLCQMDPFCCSERHDELCVREATSSCGLACEPPPPLSDCCSASPSPGCSQPPVLACVCDVDPACCQLRFDQSCVNLAARCGAACASEGAP